MVTVAMIWDLKRGQRTTQGILRDVAQSVERIEASAERIA
jgi:hypothetical protein